MKKTNAIILLNSDNNAMNLHLEKILEIWASFKSALREIFTENTMEMAASLSYTSLLAIVPLATVVFSIFSLFPVFAEYAEQLQKFIYSNMVPTVGDAIKSNIDNFVNKAGTLTAVGISFLVITALMMLSNIENSLNQIWQVDQGRTLSQRILVYWAMISLGPLLLGAGLSLSSYFAASSTFKLLNIGGIGTLLLKLLPFMFETMAFVLAYLLTPNCKVRLSHAIIGGLIAALFFQMAKAGFGFFLGKFNTYEVIYGALAILPIFLIWIYISWSVFLLGAQITAALERIGK